jgi:hypothetical protein
LSRPRAGAGELVEDQRYGERHFFVLEAGVSG